MYTLYGIKNCDTVKKARLWLKENSVDYQFFDLKSEGLSMAILNNFATRCHWNELLNRNSTSWRQLSPEQKIDLDQDKALQLMLNTPTLIKRPVLDVGDNLIIGFKPDYYQAHR